MADWFNARFRVTRDADDSSSFDNLLSVLKEGQEGYLDVEALQYFHSRTLVDENEDIEVSDNEASFALTIPYGIDLEGLRDFCCDFGVKTLHCVFAHEREELQDWECNGEEHKTIGIVRIEKVVDEDGDDERVMTFSYPPEDDKVKISQFWRLAWNGNWTHEGEREAFFCQTGEDIAKVAEEGVRICECADDTEGRAMTLEELLGIVPITEPFVGSDKSLWWTMPCFGET